MVDLVMRIKDFIGKNIFRDVDNSWELGKLPDCEHDFSGSKSEKPSQKRLTLFLYIHL